MNTKIQRKPYRYTLRIAGAIFLSELMIMFFLSFFNLENSLLIGIVDGIALVIFLFPALYFFVYIPLAKEVENEIKANNAISESDKFKKLNTSLQMALKSVREEKEKSQSIIDAIGDGISIQDKKFKILYQNKAIIDLIGNHLGKYCYEAYERRDAVCENCPIAKTFADGKVHVAERIGITDRGPVFVENTSSPLRNESGEVIAGIEVVRDITQKKKDEEALHHANEAFRAVFFSSPLAIIALDEEGKVIQWNPGAEKIFGWKSEEVIGLPNPIISDEELPNFILLKERLLRGESFTGIEVVRQSKLGNSINISISASPLLDQQGKAKGMIALLEDISERKKIEEKIAISFERLRTLRSIDTAISASLDLKFTLSVFLELVMKTLKVDVVDVLLLNPHTLNFEFAHGAGFLAGERRNSPQRFDEGFAGLVASTRKLHFVESLANEAISPEGDLGTKGYVSYAGVPILIKGRARGVLEIFHRSPLRKDKEWFDFLETLAGQAAIAIDNATLFHDLQDSHDNLVRAYDTTIEGWSKALDYRDKETEGHSLRVTDLTVTLARQMGMGDSELIHVRRGALLHDIGKLGVPDNILLKPGKLTDEEWVLMKRHANIAFELLSPIAYLRPAIDIPYCHHEKWDGTGYPRGLKGEQIPMAARIFALIDVWDALSSDRPYRNAWPKEKVIEHIQKSAGSHFDPAVVTAFLGTIDS